MAGARLAERPQPRVSPPAPEPGANATAPEGTLQSDVPPLYVWLIAIAVVAFLGLCGLVLTRFVADPWLLLAAATNAAAAA